MWTTAAITYADRLLAFVVPIFVLKGLHDATAYTAIEYIIGLSVMVATFGDMGVRNYILYQYRQSGDRATTARLTLAGYSCVLMLQLLAIAALALVLSLAGDMSSPAGSGPLVVAALLRAGALGTTAMAYQLAVLHDRPALASLPSLCQWLAVLFALLAWPADASASLGLAVVVPCLPLMLAGLLFAVRALRAVGFAAAVRQVVTAAHWGWPLLASAGLSIGIANVSRVYGFSHLPQQDLIALNFWLRVLSVVQLTHATAMTALALEIYDHHEPGILRGNLQRYLKTLAWSLGVVAALFAASSKWPQAAPPIGTPAFMAISAYTLAWCLGAYVETYITRDGRPGLVLRMAAISASLYVLLLVGVRPASVGSLSLIMAAAAGLNLLLLTRAARGEGLSAAAGRTT
ncbi:hypothetical protein [Roseateles sp. P5_E8]